MNLMSSVESTLHNLKQFFEKQIEQYGTSAKGVDWKDQASQYHRFDQLLKTHSDKSQPCSILDYGCGYGALVGCLRDRGFNFTYTGYDMNEKALEQGRGAFGAANVTFTSDEANLAPMDYVIGSGLFNMKFDTPEAEWKAHILRTIDRMWSLSKHGLAFNSLTSYSDADKMRADLYYADPLWLFDYCKRNLSKQVALLHDYGMYDFTILVRREA
jgi:SAM-dependent methyltransferase